MNPMDKNKGTLIEKLVCVNKHSRTMKGGRIMSYSALVVVGDGEGRIGFARGKAKEVPISIQKATQKAKRNMVDIATQRLTIWYPITHESGATKIFMAPAANGTGIVAGLSMRYVFEALGIQNVITKVYGATTPMNVVKATVEALQKMRSASHFARKRGMHPSVFFQKKDEVKE